MRLTRPCTLTRLWLLPFLGTVSFQNSLSVDASVEGGLWTSKFSASAGYKAVKDGVDGKRKSYVESSARCIQYIATLKKGIKVRKARVLHSSEVAFLLLTHQP